ncbi:MAG: hypothetical protein OXC71_03295 [Chloroflexi bacterium]|nr:hypothetical protein [Chloroflexota bacterium]
METLIADTIEDLHSIIVHFPIALLVLLAPLTAYVVLRPGSGMLQTTWLLLVCQQRSESDPGQRLDGDPLRRHDPCWRSWC